MLILESRQRKFHQRCVNVGVNSGVLVLLWELDQKWKLLLKPNLGDQFNFGALKTCAVKVLLIRAENDEHQVKKKLYTAS